MLAPPSAPGRLCKKDIIGRLAAEYYLMRLAFVIEETSLADKGATDRFPYLSMSQYENGHLDRFSKHSMPACCLSGGLPIVAPKHEKEQRSTVPNAQVK